jgi:hypothetical protein
MSNPSKRKGTAAESAVVAWLRDCGCEHVERRALAGSSDKGDIAGLPGVVVEVKAEKGHNLAGWVDELEVEIRNAHASTGVVIAKRRGTTNVDSWYAIMPARRWAELVLDDEGRVR